MFYALVLFIAAAITPAVPDDAADSAMGICRGTLKQRSNGELYVSIFGLSNSSKFGEKIRGKALPLVGQRVRIVTEFKSDQHWWVNEIEAIGPTVSQTQLEHSPEVKAALKEFDKAHPFGEPKPATVAPVLPVAPVQPESATGAAPPRIAPIEER